MTLVDKIVCSVLVEPVVLPVPEDEEDRTDDQLYVDEVSVDDKLHIFGFAVGGADELQPFPEQQGAGVEHPPPRKNVRPAAKRTSGSGRR